MNKIKISPNCTVDINGFQLTYFQHRLMRKNLQKFNHKVPSDSIIHLYLSYHNNYHADLSITSSEFGCHIKADSYDCKELLKSLFSKCNQEIKCWENSKEDHSNLAPYFGGYPSYYNELKA